MGDPKYAHEFWPNRKGNCKQIVGNKICGEVPSGSLCEVCHKKIDDLNGNPDFWGVALPYQNGNGKVKYYHRGCVANISVKIDHNEILKVIIQDLIKKRNCPTNKIRDAFDSVLIYYLGDEDFKKYVIDGEELVE